MIEDDEEPLFVPRISWLVLKFNGLKEIDSLLGGKWEINSLLEGKWEIDPVWTRPDLPPSPRMIETSVNSKQASVDDCCVEFKKQTRIRKSQQSMANYNNNGAISKNLFDSKSVTYSAFPVHSTLNPNATVFQPVNYWLCEDTTSYLSGSNERSAHTSQIASPFVKLDIPGNRATFTSTKSLFRQHEGGSYQQCYKRPRYE